MLIKLNNTYKNISVYKGGVDISMKYIYITEDNIENRQNYMYSNYDGIDFLNSYFQTREDFINTLYDCNICNNKYEEYLKYCSNELKYKNIDKNTYQDNKNQVLNNVIEKGFLTLEKLEYIISNIISGNIDYEIGFYLSGLVKSFEVNKRVYEEYTIDFRPKYKEKFNNINLYILLSIATAIFYKKTGNLKFLNVLIKLNDTLISINSRLLQNQRILLLSSIKLEILMVKILCVEKGLSYDI